MTKVGVDKRLSYYQLTADEVITELRSHRYGLTAPEAGRRLQQNGANSINSAEYLPIRNRAVAQPWLLALLIAAVAGAWYKNEQQLAAAVLLLTLLTVLFDVWREHGRNNLQYHLHQLIPKTATVRRNDLDVVIDSTELVVGDIVRLEVGVVIPADVRILEANKLLIDDSTLFGSGHNPKFAHAISATVPLAQKHNLGFCGTHVISGSGLGIVTATGMQTELGRIVAQAEVVGSKQSLFQRSFYQLTRRFGWIAIVFLLGLGITIARTSVDGKTGGTYALALIVSLLPVSVAFAAARMFAIFGSDAKQKGLSVGSNAVADRLGGLDTLLIDETDFIIEPNATVTEFLIGKQLQKPSVTQLSPKGALLNEKGKPLSQKTLAEQQLFFDALALSTHTILLPPDGNTSLWHAAGPTDETALVALASQAGIDITKTRHDHPQLAYHPFDHGRKLASTVHQYDHRQMAFVYGAASSLISNVSKTWDAGHTRKFTATDRDAIAEYCEAQAKLGNHVVALAYRQLAQKTDGANLVMTDVEKDLTILGLVSIGQQVKQSAKQAIKSMQSLGIATSFISNRQPQIACGMVSQLGIKQPVSISDHELVALDDTQLLDLLIAGNTVFSHLTPEGRLRLTDIAERSSRRLAISGYSLSDIPALRHASVSLCSSSAPQMVAEESDVVLTTNSLAELTHARGRSRQLSAHLQRIMHSALADHSIQLWLVVISFGLYLSHYIPLTITATLLLVATLLQALAFAAVGDDKTGQRETPQALAPHSSLVNVWLGLIGSMLICINFVYFFVRAGLSPSYIDGSSNLYLQAATVSFATLVLCMWINLLFSRAQHTSGLLSHQLRNKTLLQIFGLVVLAMLALVYSEPIQNAVGTRSLSLADWVWVILVATSYFAVRLLAHSERQRSRYAVISLHHDVHGKDAGAKI